MSRRKLVSGGQAEPTDLVAQLGRFVSRRTALAALREIRSIGTHLALYPLGIGNGHLRPPREAEADTFSLPVVLVHGYFHNRSGFFFLTRALRKRGFRWVYGMNYNPLGSDIPALASALSRHVENVLEASGAPRVHLVGHSLGGLVARWYVQELGGAQYVDHCVTIGTPHNGTFTAYMGLGETARQMRPGSWVIRLLHDGLAGCRTKFVNLYSDLDVLIVPPASARLPDGPTVHNHLIRDLGHLSMLISPELISVITDHLACADVHTPLAEVQPLPKRVPRGRITGSAGLSPA